MKNLGFEHIGFSDSGKTEIWNVFSVYNPSLILGRIRWHGPWRKYGFFPEGSTLFDAGCLDEIGAQLVRMTSNHKTK